MKLSKKTVEGKQNLACSKLTFTGKAPTSKQKGGESGSHPKKLSIMCFSKKVLLDQPV
jgi:hypothetical protein